VSTVLQCAQVGFILNCAIVINEGSSTLRAPLGGPPLSLFDMLITIGGGSRT
jgi:hypothetical protein